MQAGQPSRTALGAAGFRAAHQVLDHAAIFADPLALRILGADGDDMVREAAAEATIRLRFRWFIAIRSRIAEDRLAVASQRGVRQLVVLGAGLDTYAYRAPPSQVCEFSRSIIPRPRRGNAAAGRGGYPAAAGAELRAGGFRTGDIGGRPGRGD